MEPQSDPPPPVATPNSELKPASPGSLVRIWNSQEILGTTGEAKIMHGEDAYRLILTRNNKLILMK